MSREAQVRRLLRWGAIALGTLALIIVIGLNISSCNASKQAAPSAEQETPAGPAPS